MRLLCFNYTRQPYRRRPLREASCQNFLPVNLPLYVSFCVAGNEGLAGSDQPPRGHLGLQHRHQKCRRAHDAVDGLLRLLARLLQRGEGHASVSPGPPRLISSSSSSFCLIFANRELVYLRAKAAREHYKKPRQQPQITHHLTALAGNHTAVELTGTGIDSGAAERIDGTSCIDRVPFRMLEASSLEQK